MSTRRQVVITKAGAPEVLQVKESPIPELNPGEVTVETGAVGVNFADILARQGLYPDAPSLPCVVGYEFGGVVTALGPDVDKKWKGKQVFGLSRFGGYSSHINVPTNQIFVMPKKMSFEEAATIPVAYVTAYQLAVAVGNLQSYETILIHNAGGGVGLALLDIAKHIGARSIGTASTRKHEFLKKRGLDHAIDYTKVKWEAELNTITEGRGVELVTDPLGGKHWKRSYKALRATGRLGMFGVSTASATGIKGKFKMIGTAVGMPFYHPINMMNRNTSVFGVNLGRMWHEVDRVQIWMEELIKGYKAGWVQPYVDQTFSFKDAAEAHRCLEERRNIGKVLLIP